MFAFSVGHLDELREVADLEQDFALHPIWIAPARSTAPTMLAQLRWMTEIARRRGWHVSAGMLAGRRT